MEANKYINIHQVHKAGHESKQSLKLDSATRISQSSSKHNLQKNHTNDSSRERLNPQSMHIASNQSLPKQQFITNFNH